MTINEIKATLTPLQIAHAAEAQYLGDGEERALHCPYPERHSQGDSKPSASLNVAKGL